MIVFISGGSGSGKSAYAEKISAAFGGKMIYIATMPVSGEEDLKKVERHHLLRKDRGFETLERQEMLRNLPSGGETVLLECMSTHVANVMFSDIGNGILANTGELADEKLSELIIRELEPLFDRTGSTIVVSAEVSSDGEIYDPLTENYKKVLMNVNKYIANRANAVIEVVCGIPVYHKGQVIEINE